MLYFSNRSGEVKNLVGQKLFHNTFGEGEIVKSDTRTFSVDFKKFGIKQFSRSQSEKYFSASVLAAYDALCLATQNIKQTGEAYLKDQKRLLPCAAYVDGAFGLNGMYVGVPTIIGAKGIERIVDIKLTADEQAMFDKSVDAVKGLVAACKGIDPSLA